MLRPFSQFYWIWNYLNLGLESDNINGNLTEPLANKSQLNGLKIKTMLTTNDPSLMIWITFMMASLITIIYFLVKTRRKNREK